MSKRMSYLELLREAVNGDIETVTKFVDTKGPMVEPILSYRGEGEMSTHKDAASILERYYYNENEEPYIQVEDEPIDNPISTVPEENPEETKNDIEQALTEAEEEGGEEEKEDKDEDEKEEDEETDEKEEDEDKKEVTTESMERTIIERLISEMESESEEDEKGEGSEGEKETETGTEAAGLGDGKEVLAEEDDEENMDKEDEDENDIEDEDEDEDEDESKVDEFDVDNKISEGFPIGPISNREEKDLQETFKIFMDEIKVYRKK